MKIYLFEPSSPSDKASFKRGLEILKAGVCQKVKDVSIEVDPNIQKPNRELIYISSNDNKKKETFEKVFQRRDVDMILLTRGGYGCSRWVLNINWRKILKTSYSKKILVAGFSDATFLACAFIKNKLQFLHAPMVCTLETSNNSSREAFFTFLSSKKLPTILGTPFKKGEFNGELIGGNLTCLCHTIGTKIEPDWHEKILLLEDVNEEIYKIDRMLTHLQMAGVFDKIGALCLGEFIFPSDDQKELFYLLLEDKFHNFNKPLLLNLPCGHGSQNMPLLLGSNYKILKNGHLVPI